MTIISCSPLSSDGSRRRLHEWNRTELLFRTTWRLATSCCVSNSKCSSNCTTRRKNRPRPSSSSISRSRSCVTSWSCFKRYLFGQRRERFVEDPAQGRLFELEDDAGSEDPPPASSEPDESATHRRRGHGRRRLPDSLPRRRIIHELDEHDRLCPCCGKLRVKVSEEISEQLEFQPASLYVKQHVRYVYACQEDACDANMVTAPKPPQPIEKGLAGPGLLAYIGCSKLADHLPLNRLEDILTRYGMHLARSTQCDWMGGCARLVRPLYELMICLALQSKVLGTDDTTVLLRDDQRDRTRTAYFWAYVGDPEHPYTVYDFTTRHSRDGPEKFLKGFQGILQGDGYSGYIEIGANQKVRFSSRVVGRMRGVTMTVREQCAQSRSARSARLYPTSLRCRARSGSDLARCAAALAPTEVAKDHRGVSAVARAAPGRRAPQQSLGRSDPLHAQPMGIALSVSGRCGHPAG